MNLSRRSFLGSAGLLATGSLIPFSLLFGRTARAATGFGPLVPDPAGILDLPAGFSYRILERVGDAMTDGYVVPGAPDGMACFPGPEGTIILMRNHELRANVSNGAYPPGRAPVEAYAPNAMGGVTRVVLDAQTFARRSSNLVLTGTIRNCAGGPSPWGWLSCEETTEPNHGWVFACDPSADRVQPPRKIVGYGRFNHEAAAVDPDTLICYLTEDEGSSCLYRFVPRSKATPFEGQLQALRVVDASRFATTTMTVGQEVEVDWVNVDADPTGTTPAAQGFAQGAAVFVRGEGVWFHDGVVYICSTSGGPVSGGQIFKLTPERGAARARLELVAQSMDRARLDKPDNITVSPWGAVFMAEDGDGDQYLRVLEADGSVVDFARNALGDGELAGVCFSPDGRALFVNLQSDGLTVVVTGPFPKKPGGGTGGETSGGGTSGGSTGGGTSGGGTSGGGTSGGGPVPTPNPLPDCSAGHAPPPGASKVALGAAVVLGATALVRREPAG